MIAVQNACHASRQCDFGPDRPAVDPEVEQLIAEQVARLIRFRAFSQSDAVDLAQRLRLEVWLRRGDYVPERGRWATFIRRILETKSVSIIRTTIAKKRDFRKNAGSLNECVFGSEEGPVERGDAFDADASRTHRNLSVRDPFQVSDVRNDVANVVSRLPCDLQKLCRLLSDKSVTDAAEELGQSRQKVYAAISQLRQRFEDAGLEAYL